MIVPRSKLDEVEAVAVAAASGFPPGNPQTEGVMIGPLVSAIQRDRVRNYIKAGIDEGAKLLVGGPDAPEGLETGYYIQPTIFSGVTRDMTIAREEIFGPVLVVLPFDDEAEAVALANDTDYGLSAGIWTTNLTRALRVSSRLQAGAIWVNTWFASLGSAAGGGRKLSGVGVEGGVPGLEELTVIKHVAMNMSDEPCGYYPAKE